MQDLRAPQRLTVEERGNVLREPGSKDGSQILMGILAFKDFKRKEGKENDRGNSQDPKQQ
jgi:hypothetical protein